MIEAGRPFANAHRPRPAILVGAVAAVVFASRVPFLSAVSYGADPDAWRIAAAGAHLAERGAYVVSRFPGNPLVELQAALLWALGAHVPLAFGLLGAAWSAVAAGALAALLHSAKASRPALSAVAFAFVPVVYAESVTAMDTLPAAALGLVALAAACRGRPGWAGLALGLAVGCRLPSVLWAVPVGIVVAGRGGWRSVGWTAAAATGPALLAWLPPLLTYGLSTFVFSDAAVSLQRTVQRGTLEVWGPTGLLALGLGVAALVRWRSPEPPERFLTAALLAGVGAFGLAFLRLPLEPSYLVPAVPLVVALLALHLRPGAFAVVGVLLLAAPFVLDLEADYALPAPEEAHVALAGPVVLTPRGPLLHDAARRRAEAAQAADWLSAVRALPPGSVVVAGATRALLVGTALRTGTPPPSGVTYAWPVPDDPMTRTADAAWLPPPDPSPARLFCLPGAPSRVPCAPLPEGKGENG